MQFEKAAHIRDKIIAIERISEKQAMKIVRKLKNEEL